MAIVFRILLILIPIVAVILWLRWRASETMDEEDREAELKRLKIGLGALVVALFAVGIGFRTMDDSSGEVDQVYVPARVEDGKVIPGKFVPRQEAEALKEKPEPSDGEGGGGAS